MPWYWVRMANKPDARRKREEVQKVVDGVGATLVGDDVFWSVGSPHVFALIGDIDERTAKVVVHALGAEAAVPLLRSDDAHGAFEHGSGLMPASE